MKKLWSLSLCVLSLLCLVNGGFQSTGGDEKPSVNFYGTVKVNGTSEQGENFLISGLYEQIKVYGIPGKAETAPTTNVTFLRLDDIASISQPPAPVGRRNTIRKFNDREYVEINVTFKGGRAKNYLVERSRKLYYDVPLQGQNVEPLKKEVALEAVDKVTISGYKQRERTQEKKEAPMSSSAAQKALCVQAKENIEKLDKASEGAFNHMLDKIREAVHYICS